MSIPIISSHVALKKLSSTENFACVLGALLLDFPCHEVVVNITVCWLSNSARVHQKYGKVE